MTLDEFFERLALTKDTLPWAVLLNGKIRAGCLCPLQAVAGRNESMLAAVRIVGLHWQTAVNIIDSADFRFKNDPMRKRILATLGLREAA